MGSARALAYGTRRPAAFNSARKPRQLQSFLDVFGEGAKHCTRGRVRSPERIGEASSRTMGRNWGNKKAPNFFGALMRTH